VLVAIPSLDTLRPAEERSLRRAIKALLDRGEIFVIAGEGGPSDPRRYVTVECFASTLVKSKERPRDQAPRGLFFFGGSTSLALLLILLLFQPSQNIPEFGCQISRRIAFRLQPLSDACPVPLLR
jgi:hypothetical protein